MVHPLDELELGEELYWEPMRAVPPGPWAGHIALAFWLAKVVRPATVVELGTHSGNSFFAFCQAVAALELPGSASRSTPGEGTSTRGGTARRCSRRSSSFNDMHFAGFSTTAPDDIRRRPSLLR